MTRTEPSNSNVRRKLDDLAVWLFDNGQNLPTVTVSCPPHGDEIGVQPWSIDDDPETLDAWASALGAAITTRNPVLTKQWANNYAYVQREFTASISATTRVRMYDHKRISMEEYHAWEQEEANRLDRAAAAAVNANRLTEPFGTMPARVTSSTAPEPFDSKDVA